MIRERGYYVVDTEYASTIAVGAPVWDGRPLPVAAMLLVAPADRLQRRRAGRHRRPGGRGGRRALVGTSAPRRLTALRLSPSSSRRRSPRE